MQANQLSSDRFDQIVHLLRRIEHAMSEEGEENWIHGIRLAITEMECAKNNETSKQIALEAVRTSYRTMMNAKDGFSDYIIWRDDFQSRVRAIKDFDAMRSELWHMLMDEADDIKKKHRDIPTYSE